MDNEQKQSLLQQIRGSPVAQAIDKGIEVARDISNSPHMAPIHAMIRQGADEIAQILPAFPSQGIQPVAEMGQLFEITPGMATEQIKGVEHEKSGRDLER